MSLATEAEALEKLVQELRGQVLSLEKVADVLADLRTRLETVEGQPQIDPGALTTILRQQDLLYQTCKLILQGRWQGEMPHAEAFCKAINPADTDWSAVPFPKA